MRINIIIPNYNKANFLEKCLLSCLKQDHKDYKVIFIDNESTDNSMYIAENIKSQGYDFVIDSAKNIYPRCWDECLDQAKKHLDGDFYTIVGSDDYVDENYLSNFESWAKDKNGKVYQSALNWYKDGQKINTIEHTYQNIDELKSKLSIGCCVNSPTVFYKTEILKNENFQRRPDLYSGASDYDFLCQIVDGGFFINRIPETIGYNYIFNDKQATWEMHKDPINYDKIIQSKWREKWTKF
tara:strand:+ start:14964 stop:15683 length:720 start_codon:yes stop_codon:yes gene_type:complete